MKRSVFLLLPLVLLLNACIFNSREKVRGNGKIVFNQPAISDFSRVSLSGGGMDLLLSEGSSYEVRVQADENLMPYIEVKKEGSLLKLGMKEDYDLRPSDRIRIFVTSPRYTGIELMGSGIIRTQNRLSGSGKLALDLTGSGTIDAQLSAPEVSGSLTGSGDLILSGTTRLLDLNLTGSGDIKAYGLMTEEARTGISGSGDVEVSVSRKLDTRITGSGDVRYRGNPSVAQQNSGSGDVTNVN